MISTNSNIKFVTDILLFGGNHFKQVLAAILAVQNFK